jgi:hypothetical protein
MPTSSEEIENTNDGRNELINILLEKLGRREVSFGFASWLRQFRSTTIFRVENRQGLAAVRMGDGCWPIRLNSRPILFF